MGNWKIENVTLVRHVQDCTQSQALFSKGHGVSPSLINFIITCGEMRSVKVIGYVSISSC